MKQTAVEWLEEQFEESYSYINEIFKETIQQAKEMEKQQIMIAYQRGIYNGLTNWGYGSEVTSEQYYKETFNK